MAIETGGERSANAARLLCEQVIERLKREENVPQEELDECERAHMDFYERLCEKHETRTNTEFSAEDRFEFYLSAMRMSVILPQKHGGWPIRAGIRRFVLSELKKRLDERDDPFLLYCAIFPALISDQYDYALTCYRRIEKVDAQWAYAVRDTLRDGCALRDNEDYEYRCGYHDGYAQLLEAVTPQETAGAQEVMNQVADVQPEEPPMQTPAVSEQTHAKRWWRLW